MLGYMLLLFIIYKGKNYLSSQYQEIDIPPNQLFRVSSNRQIINKLSLKQLKHFNRHTKGRTMGVHQLLIINSYKSYQLQDFKDYYKEYKILTLYIPLYLSYILQLLDIGCFSPLKLLEEQISAWKEGRDNYNKLEDDNPMSKDLRASFFRKGG